MPSKKQALTPTSPTYPDGVRYTFVEGEPGQFPEAPPAKKKKLTPGQAQQITQELAALRKLAARLTRRLNEVEQKHHEHAHAPGGPPQRYGVHIDAAGRYWMHRPDGWFLMQVGTVALLPPLSAGPEQAQRLVEPHRVRP